MIWKVGSRFTISSCGPGDDGPAGHEWWSKTGCNKRRRKQVCYGVQLVAGNDGGKSEGGEGREGQKQPKVKGPKQPEDLALRLSRVGPSI